MLRPLEWTGDAQGHLRLLDQTLLPAETRWLDVRDVPTLYEAIQMLRVRGAPAIGVSAAYGVVLGMQARVIDRCCEVDRRIGACHRAAFDRAPNGGKPGLGLRADVGRRQSHRFFAATCGVAC